MASVQQLFAGLDATISGRDVDVQALCYDSRRVAPGACFAALAGVRTDGGCFVAQALAAGATSVLCELDIDTGTATRVRVANARLALALAAKRFYSDPASALVMVGVTGTNGKTTITYLLEGLLAAVGLRPGVIGTLGYRYAGVAESTGMTTPESVDLVALLRQMHDSGVGAVAMEASSHALHQHRVAGVDFDVGVFTNLTHDHLDYHGTLEAYFDAKASLFARRMKDNGHAVLNFDDAFVRRLVTPEAMTFSASGDLHAKVRVIEARLSAEGTTLMVATPRGELRVTSALIGAFNVENLLAAVSVGEALGFDLQTIAAGIATVTAVPGRLERVCREPLVVIDYSHTPDALEKALRVVRGITRGRLLCVFGCGGSRDGTKRGPMGRIAATLADAVVLTNDNPRNESPQTIASEVERGLQAAGMRGVGGLQESGYVVELDRAEAIRAAIAAARAEDAVLIAGKGHETYQIIGEVTRHFDDREQARQVLRGLGIGEATA